VLIASCTAFVAIAASVHFGARHLNEQAAPAARAATADQAELLARRTGIAAAYWRVDPRTAKPVRLDQPLTTRAPVFPGDPPFRWRVVATVAADGFLLEQITSLGTHTGTHISAPCHFHAGTRCLARLPVRFFAPRPLVVIDVRDRIRQIGGDFFVRVADLRSFEREHGRIPRASYVVLLTGLSRFWHLGNRRLPGSFDDYFDSVPGFSGPAVDWLFEQRGILGVGADTFGPDATTDAAFAATTQATAHGGITLENLGPSLASMRPFGDWIQVNGPRYATAPGQKRPGFSGAQMGMTGFTPWR